MGTGVYNNTGLGVSEFNCPTAPDTKVAASVPTTYDKGHGQMDFLKRSSGDTVYIGLGGKRAGAKQYDIILTDAIPSYNVEGLVLGDIYVAGTLANNGSLVSITILACT